MRVGIATTVLVVVVLAAVTTAMGPVQDTTASTDEAPTAHLAVDDDGNDCPEAGYETIQAAVDDGKPGDTVRVCSGTYTESVLIQGANKTGLSLIADGDVLLDGEAEREVGIQIQNVNGVMVNGFEIRDYKIGILDEPDNTDFTETPIVRRLPTDSYTDLVRRAGTVLVDNTITADRVPADSDDSFDHYRTNPSGITLSVLVKPYVPSGIVAASVDDMVVRGNTIEHVDVGIHLIAVVESTITDNDVAVKTDPPEAPSPTGPVRGTAIVAEQIGTLQPSGEAVEHIRSVGQQIEEGGDLICHEAAREDPEQSSVGGKTLCPPMQEGTDTLASRMDLSTTKNTYTNNTVTSPSDAGSNPGTGGILLYTQGGDRLANNTVQESPGHGIGVYGSERVVLEDNRVEESQTGIELFTSSNATLKDNTVIDTRFGLAICCSYDSDFYGHDIDNSNTFNGKQILYVEDASNREITGGDVVEMAVVVDSHNVTLRDVQVQGGEEGIQVVGSTDTTVENATVRNTVRGIVVGDGQGVRVANNTVTGATHLGIELSTGQETTVANNTIVSDIQGEPGSADPPQHGIQVKYTDDNHIVDNQVRGYHAIGISIARSAGDRVANNTVTDSHRGMRLTGSHTHAENNTLRENSVGLVLLGETNTLRDHQLRNNTYNFHARGSHDVDRSNTVDGKPIYYLVDESDRVLDAEANAGAVMLWDSENITVRDQAMSNVGTGVWAGGGSSGLRVENVTVETAVQGMWFAGTEDVEVVDSRFNLDPNPPGWTETNAFVDPGVNPPYVATHGVVIDGGSDVLVENVTVSEARVGVSSWYTSGLTVANSTISPGQPGGDTQLDRLLNQQDAKIREVVPAGIVQLGEDGSAIPGGDSAAIRDNKVSNAMIGIVSWLTSADAPPVENNRITDTEAGILSWGSTDDEVTNNTLESNRHGVVAATYLRRAPAAPVHTTGLDVVENTVTGNANGLFVNTRPSDDGEANLARQNLLAENTHAGVLLAPEASADHLRLTQNTIADNGAYGINASAVNGTVDARNNYWGASDGPSSPASVLNPLEDPQTAARADGSGDAVSQHPDEAGVSNVRFDPWLTSTP